jgi:hypothetical protein
MTALQRFHLRPCVTPIKQDILSQIQITLSRDTKFTHTYMKTDHYLIFILRHVTVYPLPVRLVASRTRQVAPPTLPVASNRAQNTFTASLYKPCNTSDSRSREEGGSLHPKKTQNPTQSFTHKNLHFHHPLPLPHSLVGNAIVSGWESLANQTAP